MDCPICYEKYNTQECLPMTIPCGHSFCCICLIKINDKCPICKVKIPKPPRTARGRAFADASMDDSVIPSCAKPNYALINLLSHMKNVDNSHNANDDSLTMGDKAEKSGDNKNSNKDDLTKCKESDLYEDYYCSECDMLCCQKCYQSSHSDHLVRRLSPSMVSLKTNLSTLEVNIMTTLVDLSEQTNNIEEAKLLNTEALLTLPKRLDQCINSMISTLLATQTFLAARIQEEISRNLRELASTERILKEKHESVRLLNDQVQEMTARAKKNYFKEDPVLVKDLEENRAKAVDTIKEALDVILKCMLETSNKRIVGEEIRELEEARNIMISLMPSRVPQITGQEDDVKNFEIKECSLNESMRDTSMRVDSVSDITTLQPYHNQNPPLPNALHMLNQLEERAVEPYPVRAISFNPFDD